MRTHPTFPTLPSKDLSHCVFTGPCSRPAACPPPHGKTRLSRLHTPRDLQQQDHTENRRSSDARPKRAGIRGKTHSQDASGCMLLRTMASRLQIRPSPPHTVILGLHPVISPLSGGFLLSFVYRCLWRDTEATGGKGGSLRGVSVAFQLSSQKASGLGVAPQNSPSPVNFPITQQAPVMDSLRPTPSSKCADQAAGCSYMLAPVTPSYKFYCHSVHSPLNRAFHWVSLALGRPPPHPCRWEALS